MVGGYRAGVSEDDQEARRLGDVGERGVLAQVFAALADQPSDGVLLGPGDDTAYLSVRSGALLTTDTMVREHDWLDAWSTPRDVATKAMTQNLADLASMGGVGTGVLVTLIADDALPVRWARGLAEGLAAVARVTGVPVIGGDLSAAPSGMVAVSVTALGELPEGVDSPVLRSGASPGEVLAVSGPLGRSGAGLELLRTGLREGPLVDYHLRPVTDLAQGPVAARAGATAMIDVSDGLGRDADRLARASDVVLRIDPAPIETFAAALLPLTGATAYQAVLSGGEEHELLATFPRGAVPEGWIGLGDVLPAEQGEPPGVVLGAERLDPRRGGWDHYGG